MKASLNSTTTPTLLWIASLVSFIIIIQITTWILLKIMYDALNNYFLAGLFI